MGVERSRCELFGPAPSTVIALLLRGLVSCKKLSPARSVNLLGAIPALKSGNQHPAGSISADELMIQRQERVAESSKRSDDATYWGYGLTLFVAERGVCLVRS